jgi:hypothetical protein
VLRIGKRQYLLVLALYIFLAAFCLATKNNLGKWYKSLLDFIGSLGRGSRVCCAAFIDGPARGSRDVVQLSLIKRLDISKPSKAISDENKQETDRRNYDKAKVRMNQWRKSQ